MESSDNLVRQIISKSGITGAARRELARELASHIEDAVDELCASGHDEVSVQEIVSQRFGDPQEIARALAETYRTERIAAYTGIVAALLAASLVAVGAMISTVQLFVAIWSGTAFSAAFRGMRWELFGFLCLTWGYVGIDLGERLFRNRLVPAVTVNVLLFLPAALGFHHLAPGHATAPIVAFVCAGMVRILQQPKSQFIWCAGTAGPLLCAWLLLGPLVRSNGPLTSWEMGLIVWLGMTLSCLAMTSLTKLFDRKMFTTSRSGS